MNYTYDKYLSDEDNIICGKRYLSQSMERLNLNQKQIAALLGYSQSHMSRLMNGREPLTDLTKLGIECLLHRTGRYSLANPHHRIVYRDFLDSFIEQER